MGTDMKILAFLFSLLWSSCASAHHPALVGVIGKQGSATCSDTPFYEQDTHDTGMTIGVGSLARSAGFVNTSATTISICAVDLYARQNGSLSGYTLYVEKWTVNTGALYDLLAKQEDIVSIDASTLPSTIGYTKISFGKTVTIAQNEALVFTLNDTSGATNNITMAHTSTSVDANKRTSVWEINLNDSLDSSGADMRIKLYGN